MGLDALLSIGAVTVGLHFFGPAAWSNHEAFMLKYPGVIPAPVHKFLDFVTREHQITYWIGSIKNDLYTFQPSTDGKEVVSYYSGNSKPPYVNIPIITITTYRNSSVYQTATHRLLADTNKQMVIQGGKTIEFDGASMKSEVIRFQNKPVIITIEYQTTQYETDLIVDAENLKPLG